MWPPRPDVVLFRCLFSLYRSPSASHLYEQPMSRALSRVLHLASSGLYMIHKVKELAQIHGTEVATATCSSLWLRRPLLLQSALEAVLDGFHLVDQATQRCRNDLRRAWILGPRLNLHLNSRLQRVGHTVSSKQHLLVLKELHPQQIAERVILALDHHRRCVLHASIGSDCHPVSRKTSGEKDGRQKRQATYAAEYTEADAMRASTWWGSHALLHAVVIGQPPAVEVVGLVHECWTGLGSAPRAAQATTDTCEATFFTETQRLTQTDTHSKGMEFHTHTPTSQ